MPAVINTVFLYISIHTPARGVTAPSSVWIGGLNNFNPHSRKGSDADPEDKTTKAVNFNPHSRKGSDEKIIVI